ncbi:hypothetical protein [Methylotuvimicrobium buryatense]|nr:hypothetical protein [Methylotuvimicrobium buryatense]
MPILHGAKIGPAADALVDRATALSSEPAFSLLSFCISKIR